MGASLAEFIADMQYNSLVGEVPEDLELSRYAAKTFSVSNVLCEPVRKPQTGLKVGTDFKMYLSEGLLA